MNHSELREIERGSSTWKYGRRMDATSEFYIGSPPEVALTTPSAFGRNCNASVLGVSAILPPCTWICNRDPTRNLRNQEASRKN